MLRLRVIKLLKKFLRRQAFVKYFPHCRWDARRHALGPDLTRRGNLLLILNTIFQVVSFTLVAIATPDLIAFNRQKTHKLVIVIIMLAACLFCVVLQCGVAWRRREIIAFVSSFMRMETVMSKRALCV